MLWNVIQTYLALGLGISIGLYIFTWHENKKEPLKGVLDALIVTLTWPYWLYLLITGRG